MLIWGLGAVLALLAACAAIAGYFKSDLEKLARSKVIEKIEARFGSQAELDGFQLRLGLPPVIRAEGLVVRRHGRSDLPPLISIDRFSATLSPADLLRSPVRVRHVELEGLLIQISHDSERDDGSEESRGSSREKGEGIEAKYPFIIEELIADGTTLRIFPREAHNEPLIWEIYRLQMRSVGVDQPMAFKAQLMNAKPPGLIDSEGSFGPWNAENPGQTPVSGDYSFENADLSVFKGISGSLSSEGIYRGVLNRIEVEGFTDTPDFAVAVAGQPVHLRSDFSAVVDGTNGNTLLQPVRARFLQSTILARGGVVKEEGEDGKTIRLRVQVEQARIEDLLKLGMKQEQPPLVGDIRVDTEFVLPPKDRDVAERLFLDGNFEILDARFTSRETRRKLEELSWRARGRPDEETDPELEVASEMRGDFRLRDGVATFANLAFRVPGADVLLDGTFDLQKEELEFRGKLRMEASLSQTTGGVKSVLLRLVDPFFRKDGAGAVVPIKIEGPLESPDFGLDLPF